jgi:hypothetical protein
VSSASADLTVTPALTTTFRRRGGNLNRNSMT